MVVLLGVVVVLVVALVVVLGGEEVGLELRLQFGLYLSQMCGKSLLRT